MKYKTIKLSKQELKKNIDDLITKINDKIFKRWEEAYNYKGEKLQIEIIGTYNQNTVLEEELLNILNELKVFFKNGISNRLFIENNKGVYSLCGQEYSIIEMIIKMKKITTTTIICLIFVITINVFAGHINLDGNDSFWK